MKLCLDLIVDIIVCSEILADVNTVVEIDGACFVEPELGVDRVGDSPGHHVDHQQGLHGEQDQDGSLVSTLASIPSFSC